MWVVLSAVGTDACCILQESDNHEHGAKGRPVLEAKLQVSNSEPPIKTNSTAPVMPGGGVTAALGVGRPAGNAPPKNSPGPPHLPGIPSDAPQSGVSRLVGVTSTIVSRPRHPTAEEQFRRQLATRALLREHNTDLINSKPLGASPSK